MKNILFIFLCFIQFQAISQSKRVWIYEGDTYFEKLDYHNALLNYQAALSDTVGLSNLVLPYEIQTTMQNLSKKGKDVDSSKSVSLEDYLNHQIAICYLNTFDYTNAETHLLISSNSEGYPEDKFELAKSLMNNEKYEEAIVKFEEFIRSGNGSGSLVRVSQLSMTGCFYANDVENYKEGVEVVLADTTVFNSGTSAFAAAYFGGDDRLMFSSARPNGVILDPEQQSEFLCDVYWTEKDDNGKWKEAVNFGRPMNSAQHDAASAINNNNAIFYTRWNDNNLKERSIYLARMINFQFFEAYKLDSRVNVEGYKSQQPFISMDGKTMYFSSNKPGGKGGMDIWKIALDSLGNLVGDAINLDYPINSEANEVTPFFHEASSTLFYSSDGFNSIGGLDVFKSSLDREADEYTLPENMGMPINSSYDDAYLVWDTKLARGFMSSDREPCEGGHCYDIYEVNNEPIVIKLEGVAYDFETNEVLANTKLTFKDVDGKNEPFEILTDVNGYYSKLLTRGQELFIKAQKEKYFADAAVVNTKSITENTTLVQDFFLKPIPKDDIEIDGIEYDFDSDKLRPASLIVLDKLVEFLELNQNLTVEINSHTDERGSHKYNQKLSARRAKSCVDYLILQGIDPNRLSSVGYGESQPNFLVDANKNRVKDENGADILLTEDYINSLPTEEEQELAHQANRRTSFKVTGENFELNSK